MSQPRSCEKLLPLMQKDDTARESALMNDACARHTHTESPLALMEKETEAG